MNRIITDREILKATRKKFKDNNQTVVFTNGCFDILHAGHVDYLCKAKELGDILIVALNSDESVKRIKGNSRPITNLNERLFVISNLRAVDVVTVFDEDTPYEIIKKIVPDILVKGADWQIDDIVGKDIVESNGGKVLNIKFEVQQSTSNLIDKIIKNYKK